MIRFRDLIVAGALAFGASSASALTVADVQAALGMRVSEIEADIAALDENAPGYNREVRLLTARKRQLVAFSRIVPRYPEARLSLVVARFDLDVSPS